MPLPGISVRSTPENFSLTRSMTLLRVARRIFWSALTFTGAGPLMPAQVAIQPVGWDQAERFAGCYVLRVPAAAAFACLHMMWIAIELWVVGAGIGVPPRLKIVSMDRDFCGWLPDKLAIASARVPIGRFSWQRRCLSRSLCLAPASEPRHGANTTCAIVPGSEAIGVEASRLDSSVPAGTATVRRPLDAAVSRRRWIGRVASQWEFPIAAPGRRGVARSRRLGDARGGGGGGQWVEERLFLEPVGTSQ